MEKRRTKKIFEEEEEESKLGSKLKRRLKI